MQRTLLLLLLLASSALGQQAPRYEYRREHDPNGIGKFYLGREIAHVMGYEAAGWLDRPEREKEENPTKLLDALKLQPGEVVADVGAGSGYLSFRMAEQVGPKGKVLAVDIQPEMLAIIRKKAKDRGVTNVETVAGTVTDPKLPAGAVDTIIMVDVYHEFSHPYEMTAEMVKALKPGGRIVFVEYRMEDEDVPIKLVHKMSEKQVAREMAPFPLKHFKTFGTLPWQHIIVYQKLGNPPANPAKPMTNYDEAKVAPYKLPELLVTKAGKTVATAEEWTTQRRPEIFELFEDQVYGRVPPRPAKMTFQTQIADPKFLGGKATRKQVTIRLDGTDSGPKIDLMLIVPNGASGKVPAFAGLSFGGNHAVSPDPAISITTNWIRNDKANGIENNRAVEKSRGNESRRWPLAMIVDAGYAVATAYYGDLEPDHAEGWKDGVRARFPVDPAGKSPVTGFAPGEWGAIGAWGWGLSRILDYLETDEQIDAQRVAVIGHSRLGKTSLWAGARDQRFAAVISNNSGEGGAAIARRNYGERTADLNRNFPHWFNGNFKKYSNNEENLPVDAHQLIALAAPRPVYVASAEEDRWADPKGEFLAAYLAGPVYQLFGRKGIASDQMPGVNQAVGTTVGYHIRTGKHDVTDYDWQQYIAFLNREWKTGR